MKLFPHVRVILLVCPAHQTRSVRSQTTTGEFLIGAFRGLPLPSAVRLALPETARPKKLAGCACLRGVASKHFSDVGGKASLSALGSGRAAV